MRVTFPAYGSSATATFKCRACEKDKRKRSFRAEHTVNPFNKNPDGSIKLADQVYKEAIADAKLQRDRFMIYPLCRACEDVRSWSEMKSIRERRLRGDAQISELGRQDCERAIGTFGAPETAKKRDVNTIVHNDPRPLCFCLRNPNYLLIKG